MPQGYHTNGVATLSGGTGASNALEVIGYGGHEGVDIEIDEYTDPVFSDAYGPHVPEEEQQFLKDALVRVRLVSWDDAVLAKWRNVGGNSADDVTQGDCAPTGQFWLANSKYKRLLIASPTDTPWNFLAARLRGAIGAKVGTRFTEWNLTFYARPVVVSTVKVLYNRVIV